MKQPFLSTPSIFSEFMLLMLIVVAPLVGGAGWQVFSHFNIVTKEQHLVTLKILSQKKANTINHYIDQHLEHIEVLSKIPLVKESIVTLSNDFHHRHHQNSTYRQHAEKHHDFLSQYIAQGNYEDLFLIDPDGHIIYSVKQKSDFASNLLTGPYRETNLGKVFRQSIKFLQTNNSSFSYYKPSASAAAFIATPIIHNGVTLGVLALQLHTKHFYNVINNYTGLKETGEIVVGQWMDNHVLITAPLRHDPDAAFQRTIDGNAPNAWPIREAVQGKSGEGLFVDWRGQNVLAVWQYIPALKWGMVVKMDEDEAFGFWQKKQKELLVYILLVLLITCVVLFVFTRRIVNPLKQIQKASVDFSLGQQPRSMHEVLSMPNEVGALARSFKHMFEQVRNSSEKLQTSEQEAKRVTASMSEGVLVLNKKGTIIRANHAVCKLLNYKERALLGQPMSTLFEKEVFAQEVLDSVASNVQQRIDMNQKKFFKQVRRAPLSVVIVNADHHILLANTHAEKLFGYDAGELDGKPYHLIVPDTYGGAHDFLSKSTDKPIGLGVPFPSQHKDGSSFESDIGITIVKIDQKPCAISIIRHPEKDPSWDIVKTTRFGKMFTENTSNISDNSGAEEGAPLTTILDKNRAPIPTIMSTSPLLDEEGELTGAVMVLSDMRKYLSVVAQKNIAEQNLEHKQEQHLQAIKLLETENRLTEEREKHVKELFNLSNHDALTQIPNRRFFDEQLKKIIAISKRGKRHASVLFLDLNRFKPINDLLGHAIGDEVLKIVASRLAQTTRDSDIIARIGGDEFTVLLPDTDTEQAFKVAHKVNQAIKEEVIVDQHNLNIGCSIGIATFPVDGDDHDTLLTNADQAMYHAKTNHLNISSFHTELEGPMKRRLLLEHALIQSTSNGQMQLAYEGHTMVGISQQHESFPLHYQTQHNTSGDIVGLECLIRWKHPELGNVSPAEFIPIAEHLGIMDLLTDWVFQCAAAQALAWEHDSIRPNKISVNISATQFIQSDIAENILTILHKSGVKPDWFELEITETAAMDNPEATIVVLQKLSDAGMTIAIDDFGTGYSSLAYLKRLPVDILKIDMSFIRNLPSNKDDMVLVRSIIAMSHALGMKVVAEGVENNEQLQFLQQNGCDIVQGYLYSKPLPKEEASLFLHQALSKGSHKTSHKG